MMTLSLAMRKRFVRDFGLPIALLEDPYFDYFLDLYDSHFQTRQKLGLLREALEAFGGEEGLFQETRQLRQRAIEAIEATAAFARFRDDGLDDYQLKAQVAQEKVYHPTNADAHFVSLDLKKANFEALRHYDPALVLEKESYAALIRVFSELAYFRESKYLRQVLFGHLLPKKQQKIQTYLIHQLIEAMKGRFERFTSASSDEVIIPSTAESIAEDLAWAKDHLPFSFVRVEGFQLRQIEGRPFYVKEFVGGQKEVEFKAVPGHLFAQCFKHYFSLPVGEEDLTFVFEGRLAVFKEPFLG